MIWDKKVSKMNDCTIPIRMDELECQQQKNLAASRGKSSIKMLKLLWIRKRAVAMVTYRQRGPNCDTF
jgi:hypothetical protein